MSNKYEGDERRDHPRVPIDGQLQGEIEASVVAHLMDLSLSGTLLEVPSALPANARYSLKLPMSETESVSSTPRSCGATCMDSIALVPANRP